MSNKRKINAVRVSLHVAFVLPICLLLNYAYQVAIGINPIIPKLSLEYSLTAWQVFSSLSTLTVALLSILQGRVDERYYGLCVKDVLFLTKFKSFFSLNYWEKVIIVLCLICVAGIFLVFSMYMAALLSQLWSFVLLLQLLVDSIGVFTQSPKYREIALNYCNNLMLHVQQKNMEEAKQLIMGLSKEAEDRIQVDLDPKNNIPLDYLLQHIIRLNNVQKRLSGEPGAVLTPLEHELHVQLLLAVEKVYERSIAYQAIPYIRSLVDVAVFIRDSHRRRMYNALTWRAYYQAKVPFECLQSLVLTYTDFSLVNDDLLADLLPVIKVSIDKNDRILFGEIIAKTYGHISYNSQRSVYGSFILIVIAYMYYYCLREPLIRPEDSLLCNQLFDLDLRKLGEHFSLKGICQTNGKVLLRSFSDVLKHYKKDYMFWEIGLEGEAKLLQIHRIVKEFIAFFFCYCGYSHHVEESEFTSTSLEDLTDIYTIIKAVSDGDAEVTQKYVQFVQWMGKSKPSGTNEVNSRTLARFENAIKEKVLAQAKETRKKRKVLQNTEGTISGEISDSAKQGALFGIPDKDISGYEICGRKWYTIENIRIFSEEFSLRSLEAAIADCAQNDLFLLTKEKLRRIIVEGRDAVQEDYDRVLQADNDLQAQGVSVDSAYNYPIFELYRYFDDDISEETKENMREFSKSIKTGEFWTNHLNAVIYLDSSKGLPRFYFTRKSMIVSEQLKDAEIIEYIEGDRYKKGEEYYPVSAFQKVPFTREEAIKYLKIALFKIEFEYYLFVPKEKIGFYTVYQDET